MTAEMLTYVDYEMRYYKRRSALIALKIKQTPIRQFQDYINLILWKRKVELRLYKLTQLFENELESLEVKSFVDGILKEN